MAEVWLDTVEMASPPECPTCGESMWWMGGVKG